MGLRTNGSFAIADDVLPMLGNFVDIDIHFLPKTKHN